MSWVWWVFWFGLIPLNTIVCGFTLYNILRVALNQVKERKKK